MQPYVGKQNWEKFLAIDFHISVTQCERKYTAFTSKLFQTQTKSIIFTNCNLQQTALYYRLWLFNWYYKIHFQQLSEKAAKKCEIRNFMTGRVSAVVFNLFHTVTHFSTQGNLTTHFGQQNLIPVTKNLVISKKKVFTLNLSAISQFSYQKHKKRSSLGTCFQFFDHNDFIILYILFSF